MRFLIDEETARRIEADESVDDKCVTEFICKNTRGVIAAKLVRSRHGLQVVVVRDPDFPFEYVYTQLQLSAEKLKTEIFQFSPDPALL